MADTFVELQCELRVRKYCITAEEFHPVYDHPSHQSRLSEIQAKIELLLNIKTKVFH